MKQKTNKNSSGGGQEAFPSRNTILIGLWLLVFSGLSVIGLYWAFLLISRQNSTGSVNLEDIRQVQESLITMFAAGVGSSITTILGYLSHASENKDFDPAYTPWYVARPVMGMLLGLVFYFVIKGGLFVLTAGNTESGAGELNLWTLSANGALVGLFSKNAIEKLRELFNTLFRTQEDTQEDTQEEMNRELTQRLPEELRAQVLPYLDGETEEVEEDPEEEGEAEESEEQPDII